MNTRAPTRTFVVFAAYFFAYSAQQGISTIYLPPVFKDLGLSGQQLGEVLSIPPLVGIFAPLVWAHLADRLGQRLYVLRSIALATVGCFFGLYFVHGALGLG